MVSKYAHFNPTPIHTVKQYLEYLNISPILLNNPFIILLCEDIQKNYTIRFSTLLEKDKNSERYTLASILNDLIQSNDVTGSSFSIDTKKNIPNTKLIIYRRDCFYLNKSSQIKRDIVQECHQIIRNENYEIIKNLISYSYYDKNGKLLSKTHWLPPNQSPKYEEYEEYD